MENQLKEKVEQSITNLREKKSKIYFLVQDTKGIAKGSVRYIYQMAKSLKDNGFNPIMLHEKNDYVGVSSWLDETYMTIPHQSIENQNLQIAPEDFIVVPEIFGYVMDQIKNLPCGKIVLTQSYSYMLDTLQPGQTWNQFGFFKCITTSESQKEYIEKIMRQSSIDVIPPFISECFEPKLTPPMPIIGIHTRDHNDAINIIKTFYLRFPQYRWFTFRDLVGLPEKEFAKSLKECFLSVWVDDVSGFGTFPLESMSCNVPVIGKIPNLNPDWMNENNGVWTTDVVSITEIVADFIQNWLEDNINKELYDSMSETSKVYRDKKEFETKVVNLFEGFLSQRSESFEQQLNKTEE